MKLLHILLVIAISLLIVACGAFKNSKVLIPVETKAINSYCAQLRAASLDPTLDVTALQLQIRKEHDAALRARGATGVVRIQCDKG